MDSEERKRKATSEHRRSEPDGDNRSSKNVREGDRKVYSRPNYGHGRHLGGYGREYFGSQNADRGDDNYPHRNRYDERDGRNYLHPRKRSHSRNRDRDNRDSSSYNRHSPDRKRGHDSEGSASGSQRDRTTGQSHSRGYSKCDTKVAPPPDPTKQKKDSTEDLDEEDLRPVSLNISCPAASTLVKQIEKRKLLFSNKKEMPQTTASTASVWQQTKFTDDSDGKMSAKFKRLMGMKDGQAGGQTTQSGKDDRVPAGAQSKDFFINLEKQYEVARTITHTQRGVGLGFGSATTFSRPNMNQGNQK